MIEQYELNNLLEIDIETFRQYSSFEQVPEHLQRLWERKIKYQRQEQTPEDFYQRAGIWAEFGKIIWFSAGIFTSGKNVGLRVKSFIWRDEKALLEKFSRYQQLSRQALFYVHIMVKYLIFHTCVDVC